MRWPRNVLAILLFSTFTSYAQSGGQAVLYMYFDAHMNWGADNATAAVSFYICFSQLFGVAGALISDHWLGKYRTQLVSCLVWVIGSAFMFVSVAHADTETSSFGLLIAMIGVALTGIGSGGMTPSLSAFVGDQATSLGDVSSFYSWYYFFMNVGSLFGESGCPLLRQHVSFTATFGSVALSMFLAMLFFCWGRTAFISHDEAIPEPHRLTCKCSPVVAHYTPEDRAGLWRVLKVFLPLPAYWALFYQQNSAWITQTAQMNTTLIWHTADILASFEDLMVCILVPLFATVVYPWLDKSPRFHTTPLRKMAFGMACTCLAFVCAALVQVLIDHSAQQSVSVAWQLPQFVLISIAETTVSVTGLEFAFTQCGPNSRSLVQSLWGVMQLGQMLTGLIAGLKIGTLEQDFWFYGALMTVFTIVFVFIALSYKYNDRTGLEERGKAALAHDHHTLLVDEAVPVAIVESADPPAVPSPKLSGTERDALLRS